MALAYRLEYFVGVLFWLARYPFWNEGLSVLVRLYSYEWESFDFINVNAAQLKASSLACWRFPFSFSLASDTYEQSLFNNNGRNSPACILNRNPTWKNPKLKCLHFLCRPSLISRSRFHSLRFGILNLLWTYCRLSVCFLTQFSLSCSYPHFALWTVSWVGHYSGIILRGRGKTIAESG